MSTPPDAYRCVILVAAAAIQSYSVKHFLVLSRLIPAKDETARAVMDCFSDAEHEACFVEYPQQMQLCMRVCLSDLSRHEDEVIMDSIMRLVD